MSWIKKADMDLGEAAAEITKQLKPGDTVVFKEEHWISIDVDLYHEDEYGGRPSEEHYEDVETMIPVGTEVEVVEVQPVELLVKFNGLPYDFEGERGNRSTNINGEYDGEKWLNDDAILKLGKK